MKYFDEAACMDYSYQLLTGKKTLTQLLDETENLVIMFNPKRPSIVMIDDVYDVLIEYFVSTEEYEKCVEVSKAKKQSLLRQA
tara:strand:+ start:71 stop:319 length:249 start_codon:yes stop_codon:yes gene_type:complete